MPTDIPSLSPPHSPPLSRPVSRPRSSGRLPFAPRRPGRPRARRWLPLLLALLLPLPGHADSTDPSGAAWTALREGAILLVRHALAPGIGDPPEFRIGDCTTQRNLDDTGREQARALGERLRTQGVRVGQVWASQWCRTLETARLMALAPVVEAPAFNSFFRDRDERAARTARARAALADWRGPGALVVVTHQVNITALVGGGVSSGEAIVVRVQDGALQEIGRLPPP